MNEPQSYDFSALAHRIRSRADRFIEHFSELPIDEKIEAVAGTVGAVADDVRHQLERHEEETSEAHRARLYGLYQASVVTQMEHELEEARRTFETVPTESHAETDDLQNLEIINGDLTTNSITFHHDDKQVGEFNLDTCEFIGDVEESARVFWQHTRLEGLTLYDMLGKAMKETDEAEILLHKTANWFERFCEREHYDAEAIEEYQAIQRFIRNRNRFNMIRAREKKNAGDT